jgi:hypothetical protein
MPDSLPELEAERSQILRQFTTLGDLRHGFDLRGPSPLRKTDLPLRQTQRPGPRSPSSTHS